MLVVERGSFEALCRLFRTSYQRYSNDRLPRIMQWYVATKIIFSIDLTSSLNHIHKMFQGKGNTAHTLLETVLTFEQQLQLFVEDIGCESLDYFESLKEYIEYTVLLMRRFLNQPFSLWQTHLVSDLKTLENINPRWCFWHHHLWQILNKLNFHRCSPLIENDLHWNWNNWKLGILGLQNMRFWN